MRDLAFGQPALRGQQANQRSIIAPYHRAIDQTSRSRSIVEVNCGGAAPQTALDTRRRYKQRSVVGTSPLSGEVATAAQSRVGELLVVGVVGGEALYLRPRWRSRGFKPW